MLHHAHASRSVWLGLLAAALFTVPAAVVMALFGLGFRSYGGDAQEGSTQALMLSVQSTVGCAATAIVASGALKLKAKLVKTKLQQTAWFVAVLGCVCTTLFTDYSGGITVLVLVVGGVATYLSENDAGAGSAAEHSGEGVSSAGVKLLDRSMGLGLIGIVLAGFVGINPMPTAGMEVQLAKIFYRCGCLVFGGGPVVVPLLLLQLTATRLVAAHQFLTGFAVVQLLPGPMLNISAFFGALVFGAQGAFICWLCLVVPGVLIALGCMPFWDSLRTNEHVKAALKGVNAAAAGLMGGAVLVLWQTLAAGATARVLLIVFSFALLEVGGVKAYVLICLAVAAGAGMGLAGIAR